MAELDLMEQMVVGAWAPDGGRRVALPIARVVEGYANRLVKRERPYRDGAKVDDTGSRPRQWDVDLFFMNGSEEPDLPADMYPGYLNEVCDALVVHSVGTLTTPTRGPRRCRVESYRRVDESTTRDAGTLSVVFVEDNEETQDASSFAVPHARSVARILAIDTQEALAEAGAWGELASSLAESAARLEELARGPGDALEGVEVQAGIVAHAAQRIERAFAGARAEGAEEASALLSDPEASRAGRLLVRLRDVAARAAGADGARRPTRRYGSTVTIFRVAADARVDADLLMRLNPGLDPFRIPAGVPIVVSR